MSAQRKREQDLIEVGEKIRIAREEKGLTQEKLAELVGVDKNSIYRYETGQSGMAVMTFFKLAEVLEKPLNELAPARFAQQSPETFALVAEITQQYNEEELSKFIEILKQFASL